MNKKGASPLVAYVLLIGMAVTISTFGYRFISNYSMDKAEDVQSQVMQHLNCDDTDVEISNLCQDSSYVYFTLENVGYDDIEGIYVNLYYSDMDVSNAIKKAMVLPMETFDYKVLKYDMIDGIDITPMLGKVNSRNVCSNRVQKFSDISYCQ